MTLAGNDVATVFPYPFRILAASDMKVDLISAAGTITRITTGYTVTGVGSVTGGSVTYPTVGAALATGASIRLSREMPITQESRIGNQGAFLPTVHENALDKLTMIAQQFALRSDLDALRGDTTGSLLTQEYVGTGSQTVFTLPAVIAGGSKSLLVSVDGVNQPTSAYSVAGSSLTFSEAPPYGALIDVRVIGAAVNVTLADASMVTATGGATSISLPDRFGAGLTVKDFGARGTGTIDDTAALLAAFQYGGRIVVPDGTYLIDTPTVAGVPVPNSGGVHATITKDLEVVCSPRAVFVGNASRRLDEALITLDGGVGTSGLVVHWYGGTIDLRNSKGSTSMPATGTWPAVDLGTSAITDGLSIRGNYTSSPGVQAAGFRNVVVDSVRFISGTHWQTAGGDSSLFVSGGEQMIVKNCHFIAARDAAIYLSSDGAGTSTAADAIIDNNTFINCIQGVASKRKITRNVITGNTFKNTGMAILLQPADGVASSDRAVVANNVMEQCSVGVRCDGQTNTIIANNIFAQGGALLADGTKPASYLNSPDFVRLESANGTLVTGNTVFGASAPYAADLPDGVFLTLGTLATACADNVVTNNVFEGIRHPIYENSSLEATGSRFYHNIIRSCQYTRTANTDAGVMEYTSNGRGLVLSNRQGGVVGLYYGDDVSGTAGALTYDHATDTFSLRVGDVVRWIVEGSTLRPNADITPDIGTAARRVKAAYIRDLRPGAGTVTWTSGAGTPEASVTGVVGSLYTRTDGGASTTLYIKESGSGNTGWIAK